MLPRLTKLQRMGIATLLSVYANTSPDGVKLNRGGKIVFQNNYFGRFTNMFVYVDDSKFEIFKLSLETDELINDKIVYLFQYDYDLHSFVIFEKGGTA